MKQQQHLPNIVHISVVSAALHRLVRTPWIFCIYLRSQIFGQNLRQPQQFAEIIETDCYRHWLGHSDATFGPALGIGVMSHGAL